MREVSIYTGSGLSACPHTNDDKVAVTVQTLDGSLSVTAEDNLLDALIDSGHAVEYQCRGGYCGACRTKVISGQVEYKEPPLAHLDSDEILPCCCQVKEALKLAVALQTIDESQQGDLFESL
ncbi:MAG: hypothetical protein CR975_07245 [Gammaproteobacteria bacterium]|nr:MAG: hypothetical protein CR975_07245 [Gammaproteobacteria bacterium]